VVLEELAHDALQFRANNLVHWHTNSSSHLLNGLLIAALQEGGGRRRQQQQAKQVSRMGVFKGSGKAQRATMH
jgi:hypothetical protein